MFNENKSISLKNSGGTVILTACIKSVRGISPRADSFYGTVEEAFLRALDEIYKHKAMESYESSDDRRKRYRFVPLRATLSEEPDENGVKLTFMFDGDIILNEHHTWRGDVLKKRRKLYKK